MLALLYKRKIKINSNNTEAQSWYNSFYYDISIFVWVIQKVRCICARSLYFFSCAFARTHQASSMLLLLLLLLPLPFSIRFDSIRFTNSFDSFHPCVNYTHFVQLSYCRWNQCDEWIAENEMKNENQMHTMRIKILKLDRFGMNYKLYAAKLPASATAAAKANKKNLTYLLCLFFEMIERMLHCCCWHHACPFELNYTANNKQKFRSPCIFNYRYIILFDRLRSIT